MRTIIGVLFLALLGLFTVPVQAEEAMSADQPSIMDVISDEAKPAIEQDERTGMNTDLGFARVPMKDPVRERADKVFTSSVPSLRMIEADRRHTWLNCVIGNRGSKEVRTVKKRAPRYRRGTGCPIAPPLLC